LEDIERDALITKMMNYLQEKKAGDRYTTRLGDGGSLATEAEL